MKTHNHKAKIHAPEDHKPHSVVAYKPHSVAVDTSHSVAADKPHSVVADKPHSVVAPKPPAPTDSLQDLQAKAQAAFDHNAKALEHKNQVHKD